jgi:hypothetical protein
MTITFKSEGSASVEMKQMNAQELLDMLGKGSNYETGVFAPDELGGAIGVLKHLIGANADRRRHLARAAVDETAGEAFEVDISLRAIPLLELFERAQENHKPVTWGF